MQSIRTQIPPTIFETFPRAIASSTATAASLRSATTTQTHQAQRQFRSTSQNNTAMSSSSPSFEQYKIQTTDIVSAPGVNLSQAQKVVTGSILDLFAGRPTLRKLSLWQDNASFVDPLTIAEGREQYTPQWYGLVAAFSNIERLGATVTSSGNPIEMDLKTRYTVKGVGSEKTIDSKIKIWTEGEGDQIKIKKVEDRWDDKLPDGGFMEAMRNLNSKVVPKLVSVPKSIEEEEKSS